MVITNRPLNDEEQRLVALINSLTEAVQRSLEAPGYESFNYWVCESNELSRETVRCIQEVAKARYHKSLQSAA